MKDPTKASQPEFQDAALADLAEMFYSCPDDPTPGGAVANASADYTIGSLGAIDDHLDNVRQLPLDGQAMIKFVLRCGAYVGEVVRRQCATKTWHWLSYEDAVGVDQTLASFGQSLGTIAVLWDGNGFCFPLGKVVKFLENGREDSVKFFAQAICAGAPGRYVV
jgi:hypothetical protein